MRVAKAVSAHTVRSDSHARRAALREPPFARKGSDPMAKEFNFDVVSSVDMQEVDNAFQQARRELSQRYDLKGSGAEVALDKQAKRLTVSAPSDFVSKQVIDVISSKLVKRGVDLGAVAWGAPQPAAGQSVRVFGDIVDGIDKEFARTISKDIRDSKIKAKVAIEGDKLRVTSSSKDALQDVIAYLKGKSYDQPIQFTNYR